MKEDILHYVLSLQDARDYERLGASDKERKAALREAVRESLRAAENGMRVLRLHWAAGVHLNTDNPHVHILVSKYTVDRETESLRRMGKLPRALVPHNERRPGGAREFVQGKMLDAFSSSVDARQRERTRQFEQEEERRPRERELSHTGRGDLVHSSQRGDPVWRARFLLGRSMIARARLEHYTAELSDLDRHGEKRRFRVYDQFYDRTRRLSEFDLRRRAGARAAAKAYGRADLLPAEREELRQLYVAQEIAEGQQTLLSHARSRARVRKLLEDKLAKAREQHNELRPLMETIYDDYKSAGKLLPVPLLSRAELKNVQDTALAARDAERFRTIEKIRLHLAAERGEPARTEREWARLRAQLREARVDLQTRRKRGEAFERTRHHARWDLGGRRWSLSRVDRELERVRKETSFVHVGLAGKFPSTKRWARSERAGLEEIRAQVVEKIAARRNELEAAASPVAETVATLEEVYEREERARGLRGERMPEALFTGRELQRMDASAEQTGDAQLLEEVSRLEAAYDARLPPEKRQGVGKLAARAEARAIIAGIGFEELESRAAHNEGRKHPDSVLVKDARGEDVAVTPYHREVRSLRSLILHVADEVNAPSSPARIERAVAEQSAYFAQRFASARRYYETAQSIAEGRRLQAEREGIEIPPPDFTARELSLLDLHQAKARDPQSRESYRKLLDAAETRNAHTTLTAEPHRQHVEARAKEENDRHVGRKRLSEKTFTR